MMQSKNALRTTILAGAGIIAISLAGCASGGGSSESTTSSTSSADYSSAICASGAKNADQMLVGTILPQTGNLSFLNPPEQAGVGLAVADINSAGGVNGSDACIIEADSGDSTDLSVSTNGAQQLIDAGVSVAVGAASSSVSLNIVDKFTSAKITEISPANTAAALSGYSPFYWRTAPPDSVQGSALGQLITGDGNSNVACLVFNDAYGTGLRDFTQSEIEATGGTVVYGAKGAGQEFPPGQASFSSEVTAALATNPDAIVILAFDETKAIIPELVAQGWDMSKTYFVDGNTSDFGKDFDPGTLVNAQGTIPGAQPNDDLKARFVDWYKSVQGGDLADFSYAAESYDATTLAALAAVKAKSNVSADIQANLAAVSGANGGEECTTFADCSKLIADGKDIHYKGASGIGPFNEKNEPSSAFIGIYKFDDSNKPIYQQSIEGETSYTN